MIRRIPHIAHFRQPADHDPDRCRHSFRRRLFAMTPIDDEIIRLRVNGRLRAAKIAQIMQVTESYIEKQIGRLVDEGRIDERDIAAPTPDPSTPPSKLPEGDAGYERAAYWLEQWGHVVTWRRFGKIQVPEIDGKLSNVGALCEMYFEGRRRWVARTA